MIKSGCLRPANGHRTRPVVPKKQRPKPPAGDEHFTQPERLPKEKLCAKSPLPWCK